ncbi:MAG: hypothetical protein HN742_02430 [Lentisphaerae bacterium]|nr:hypothetical protein [Lentisphaerota bacterium]
MGKRLSVLTACLVVCLTGSCVLAAEIVIDEFSSPELADWALSPRVWRDGKGQPIDETPFSLTHTTDAAILGDAPGGLQVEFASAKATKTPGCYGLLRRINVPHPAPETDCLVFDLIVEGGGGNIKSVDLFHVPSWRRFTAGPVPLDFSGFRQVVLKRDDMRPSPDATAWEEVNYIQFVVSGDVVFTISNMRWSQSATLIPRAPEPQRVTRAVLPVTDVTPGTGAGASPTGDIAVFARDPLRRCTYKTVPAANEGLDKLAVFSVPGEAEPTTFSVRSPTPVRGVSVSMAGDLVSGSGGAGIPAESMEIRVVTPMSLWLDTRRMREVEYLLVDHDMVDLEANRTTRFWVTVRVPENTPAETYRGALVVRTATREIARIPYHVEVLPIQLATLDDICYFMYFRPERLPAWGQTREYFTQCLVDMREHGMNGISAYVYPDGSPVMKTARPGTLCMDDTVQAIRESGLMKPGVGTFVWIAASCYGGWGVKAFTPVVREQGWEMLAYAIDEPNDERRQKLVRQVVPRLKKACPDVHVVTAIGEKGIEVVGDFYDTWICVAAHTDDKRVAQAREQGKRLWTYECGLSPSDALTCRYHFGYWLWRTGATGAAFWAYCDASAKDRFMLPLKDWTAYDQSALYRHDFVWCVPEGPIPSIGWEEAREGIEDFRYLRTLENVVAEAAKAGREGEAAEGRAFLAELRGTIDPANYGKAQDAARTRAKQEGRNTITLFERDSPEPALTVGDYSGLRRRAGELILRLQKGLK